MAKSLTDQILGAQSLPFEDIAVPEWGVEKLRICALSGTARDAWEQTIVRIENGKRVPVRDNFRARLLVRCIVDPETGERVFKDGHAEILGEKSGDVLTRLALIAMRLSKLQDEDVEELGKGSAPDQSADSGSG